MEVSNDYDYLNGYQEGYRDGRGDLLGQLIDSLRGKAKRAAEGWYGVDNYPPDAVVYMKLVEQLEKGELP